VAARDRALVGVSNHVYFLALSRFGLILMKDGWSIVMCWRVLSVIWWSDLGDSCGCVVVVVENCRCGIGLCDW
jgi:hypothetical protein